jgi:hypothetical protein
MRQRWRARRGATAKDSKSPKAHRREDYLTNVQMKSVVRTLLCCTSAKLLFSWYVLLQLKACPGRAANAGGVITEKTYVSGGAPAAKLRSVTRTRRRQIAARATLPLCIHNWPVPLYICRVVLPLLRQRRGAVGNTLGTTIEVMRCPTNGAASNGLGTTIK